MSEVPAAQNQLSQQDLRHQELQHCIRIVRLFSVHTTVPILILLGRVTAVLCNRVPTNLENLELSGNFVSLEKSGKRQGI